MQEVIRRITEKLPEMSKSQQIIAKYILNNSYTAPFFTASKLAKTTGVSEATVVRFATFLGYSGYPEFQRALQESMQKQLSTVERLKIADDVYHEDKAIYDIFQDDMARIRWMAENLDTEAFRQAVDLMVNSQRIFIIANRSAAALGYFLEFYLDLILENTELIRNPYGISEKLFRLTKQDVVVGLGFARYTQNTIDALAFAKDRGIPVIVITDHALSPLIPHADIALTAPSEMPSFIDSFVAPLSLINALITAIGHKKRHTIEQHLKELEDIWERFHIFYRG